MQISKEDAFKYYNEYIDFFETFLGGDIVNYYRSKKRQRLVDMGYTDDWLDETYDLSTGEMTVNGPQKDLFDDFSMEPNDMDFEIVEVVPKKPSTKEITASHYTQLLELTASFNADNSPGRSTRLAIMETNSGKFVAFIKLGSPVISMRPRHEYFNVKKVDLKILNQHCLNGFNIVPAQPFGFNCLGGKLAALICVCHEVREAWDDKYNADIVFFETTSLYGSIKGSSQYDGLKPLIRYRGDTESKLMMNLSDDKYKKLRDDIQDKYNDGKQLVPDTQEIPTSRKMRTQSKMLSILKENLKTYDLDKFNHLSKVVKEKMAITTQKRYYTSDFGYTNSVDYILGNTKTLTKGENYDKFTFENVIKYWKKKAQKRYENLKADGRLRKELEFWTPQTIDTIDIIR